MIHDYWMLNAIQIENVHLKFLIYAAVLYMYDTLYAILNNSENATLQIFFIFWQKVFTKA